MSLDPLLHASPIIQIHAVAAMAALVLGATVLWRRKGDARHKLMGRVWVGLMAVTALSSLFIWEIRMFGLFSPIHLLSLGTLFGLWKAVRLARLRRIAQHRRAMQAIYGLGLVVTGYFTLMPGRIMSHVVFGPDGATAPQLAMAAAVIAIVAGGGLAFRRLKSRRTALAQR